MSNIGERCPRASHLKDSHPDDSAVPAYGRDGGRVV